MTTLTLNTQLSSYVISLANASERREHIRQEFSRHNLSFSFFDAINKQNYQNYLNKYHLQVTNTNLSDGEIACFLSHFCLWQTALDNDFPYIMVFEDDVHLSSDTSEILANLSWLPTQFDVIKLETMYERVLIDNGQPINANHALCRMLGRHMGSAGYIISPNGIKMLSDFVKRQGITKPFDHILFDIFINKINFYYQVNPAICIQDHLINKTPELVSALEKGRGVHKKPKVRLTFWQKIHRESQRFLSQMSVSNLRYQRYLQKNQFKKTKIAFFK